MPGLEQPAAFKGEDDSLQSIVVNHAGTEILGGRLQGERLVCYVC